MQFLVDECTGPVVASWLLRQQHEVFSVYDEARGMHDDEIIKKAANEDWILVTNDKDFGEEVYRQQRPHRGVVLLRLANERGRSSRLRARAEQTGAYAIMCSYGPRNRHPAQASARVAARPRRLP